MYSYHIVFKKNLNFYSVHTKIFPEIFRISIFTASSRFVKCDNCQHFFIILSDVDSKKTVKECRHHTTGERVNLQKRPPPPPKKVCLNIFIHVLFYIFLIHFSFFGHNFMWYNPYDYFMLICVNEYEVASLVQIRMITKSN